MTKKKKNVEKREKNVLLKTVNAAKEYPINS